MVYIFYILVGMAAGFLSGLFGVGGGIIIVPCLLIIFKNFNLFPMHSIMSIATATSLAAVIFTSASSALAYNKKRLINWQIFWEFIPGLIIGIILGNILIRFIPHNSLISAFAVFLTLIAIQIYFKKENGENEQSLKANNFKKIMFFILSIIIGLLSLIFGIGGGIILVPTFISLGLNIRNASGTSAMCGVFIAAIATLISIASNLNYQHLYSGVLGHVYLPCALIITSFSVFFAPIGVKVAGKFKQSTLRKLFSIVLIGVALHLLRI